MKTKKFLILSFLMMITMLLAGCGNRIEYDKIKEATEIAQKIKNAREEKQEYELPEGYEQEADEQIILKTKYNGKTLKLTFDISNDSVELIEILNVEYNTFWHVVALVILLVCFICNSITKY
mgnify:CR=1 FL=1